MKTIVLLATLLALALAQNYTAQNRIYYIAAVEVSWNYLPSGEDLFFIGESNEFDEQSEQTTFKKAVYREFTNANFTEMKNRTAEEIHLGILGPVIYGTVGDNITVVFKNLASYNFSISAHGVTYNKSNEGFLYQDNTTSHSDDLVAPGGIFTYNWTVTEENAPGPNDPSSILGVYYSSSTPTQDIHSGLVGPIVITRADAANTTTGGPLGVTKEFFGFFNIFDETISLYAPANLAVNSSLGGSEDEANLKYSINGYQFGNLPGLSTTVGDNVRWYLFTLEDFHSPHWQGNTVLYQGRRTDTVPLLPGVNVVADMKVTNPGVWGFFCRVNDHFVGGMAANYTVNSTATY